MTAASTCSLLVVALAVSARGAGTEIVPRGADWRYLDDGSDPGSAWTGIGFDDSSWSGPASAEFGYGEGDEATVVDFGTDASNKYPTTYFRRTATVANGSAVKWLEMDMIRDDGAVVYLNGTEIWRANMPSGPVNYLTFAASPVSFEDEFLWYHRSAPVAGLMVDGANEFAVEVHQQTADSSDLSFNFGCSGLTDELLVPRSATWRYLDDGSDAGTAWRAPGFDDGGWSEGMAELGYGDNDEITTIGFGGNINAKFITAYFRHAFVVEDPAPIRNLGLRLRRDDGAVVYLNGTEIWRENLPDGALTASTLAVGPIEFSDEEIYLECTITGRALQAGTNLVAVEMHQISSTSSDVSFDFAMEAITNALIPVVTRGPYLQGGSPTSMVVCWRTDLATDSWVCIGDSPTNLTVATVVSGVRRDHAVPVSGLTPDASYFYAVGDTDYVLSPEDATYQFSTHPLPGAIRPVRFWVLGDSGEANQNARNVRDGFHTWRGTNDFDFVMMLGDNAYDDGTDDEYQDAVFDIYTNSLHNKVLWSTLGNHDGHSALSATQSGPYYDIFHLPKNGESGGAPSSTEAWYAFDYANIHFICLNSYDVDRTTNGAMYAWLEMDLAQVESDWIIAFWHHPPYSRGSHNSDNEFQLQEMREVYLPVLEAAGVDLVLSGHSHAYERSKFIHGHYGQSGTLTGSMVVDGGSGRGDATGPIYDKTGTNATVYAVAGSSSKVSGGLLNHPVMYVSWNLLGSMVIDVHSNRLDAFFVLPNPLVFDSFSIVKPVVAYDLTTAADGAGQVQPASGLFSAGTPVPVRAIPDPFFAFDAWQGDLSGSANPEVVVLDAPRSVTAVFEALTVTNDVPLWWLDQNGLALDDTAALDDPDDDGARTWEEWVADTDPTSEASVLQISGAVVGPLRSLEVTPASPARLYDVEYLANPTVGGSWSLLTNEVPGVVNPLVVEDGQTAPERTYRVRVKLP